MSSLLKNAIILCLIPVRWVDRLFSVRPEAVVLFYHSISDTHEPYSVAPLAFEEQLKILARVSQPVPLEHIVRFAKAEGELPRNAVAITFDDGYKDILTTALPLLRKHQVPATVFVSTHPSQDAMGNSHELLSQDELKELAQDPLIEIGSHALTHQKLTRMDAETLQKELQESKAELEQVTGKPCRFIAYPKGSVNSVVTDAVKEAGYAAGFATVHGTVKRGGDAFRIPRVIVKRDTGLFAFRWRLTRIIDWMNWMWETYAKYE